MATIFNNVRINMNGKFFPGQKVLVENGKINMVGSSIFKNVENVIECEQRYLLPGLIDAHTHLGLAEPGDKLSDISESELPITPHLRPLDGIRMHSRALEDARRAGITTCMVCPAPIPP